jgi:GT2 family glycosyltransferase
MNSYPSISAIVATYNRDSSLIDCLRSLLEQDYPGRMELIVVDQSSAHTPRMVDFFQSQGNRLCLMRQSQPNLPQARNTGIAAATGEILLFVDDDVILSPDAARRLAEHVRLSRMKAVSGLVVSERDREASLQGYARQFGVAHPDEVKGLQSVGKFIGALMMVSAAAVRAAEGFDASMGTLTPTAYGEDDEFCYRLRELGVTLWVDPSVLATHRDHLWGGCASRHTDAELTRKYHMKSLAYMRIKHHGGMGAGGWLELTRGYIANREIVRNGPGQIVRNFVTARKAVDEVRTFMAERL